MTSEFIGPYRVLSGRLDGDVERLVADAPDGRRVVLRRRGSGRGRPSPVAEAVAFARADHPHVATLVDVLTSPSGDLVLAFDGAGGDALAAWLAARGRPEPGEVVTLVVPVLMAVHHLARRGVALGGLTVDDVEIDERGAPVLVGVHPGAGGPDAERASLPVAADFARSMVERAAWPASGRAAPTLDATSFDSLVESVFDLAEAVPLSSVDAPGDDLSVHLGGDLHDPGPEPAGPSWLALLPESEAIDRVVAWMPNLRPGRVLAGLREVRPRYRVLGAGAVLVAGAALVVGATATTRDDGAAVAVSPSTEPVVASADPGEASAPGALPPSHADSAPRPGSREWGVDEVEAIVTGDDVDAATGVLLDSRLRCLRDATPGCLEAVDQPGSPIAVRDAAVLDDPSLAAAESTALELTGEASRTGAVTLLTAVGPNGEPASVLVMRTEAGWRLRDVFVDG